MDPSPHRPDGRAQQNLNDVILSWKGPSHPFKKQDTLFFQTVGSIAFLLILIVFFLHEFLLIGVILALLFVVYATYSVPPTEVEHKVTPYGFIDAGKVFAWQNLLSFWFEEKWGQRVVVFETRLAFPSQVRAVLQTVSDAQVKDVVGKYLLFREKPQKSLSDTIASFLSKTFPMETSGKHS